jgi:hypothetical protein
MRILPRREREDWLFNGAFRSSCRGAGCKGKQIPDKWTGHFGIGLQVTIEPPLLLRISGIRSMKLPFHGEQAKAADVVQDVQDDND